MNIAAQVAKSLARNILMGVGTVLVTQGYMDHGTLESIVGGLIAASSVIWGIVHHTTTVSVQKRDVVTYVDPPH